MLITIFCKLKGAKTWHLLMLVHCGNSLQSVNYDITGNAASNFIFISLLIFLATFSHLFAYFAIFKLQTNIMTLLEKVLMSCFYWKRFSCRDWQTSEGKKKKNLKQKWERRNYLIQGNTDGNTLSFLLFAFISYRTMTTIPIVHHPKFQVAIQQSRV